MSSETRMVNLKRKYYYTDFYIRTEYYITLYFLSKTFLFFYQAENKGATATEYGLVFGVFELVVFLISPVYGKHVSILFVVLLSLLGPKARLIIVNVH